MDGVQGLDIVCFYVYGSWQTIAFFIEMIPVQTKSKQFIVRWRDYLVIAPSSSMMLKVFQLWIWAM